MANNATIPGGVPVAQPVYTVDATTGAASVAGGGQQYVDGAAAPAHPTGTEIVFNNAGTMTAVSNTSGLPITGSISSTPPVSVVSTVNSTTSVLTANSVFTGTSESSLAYGSISVEVFADQASAANGLSIEQSQDGTNWDIKNTYSISASTAFQVTLNLVGQNFRVKYTNGATNQGAFRLQTVKLPYVASSATANQRVNAQSGDFVAGSIADLTTIITNTTGLATQTTLSAAKTDLDTIVTNTNKIPASPAQEAGNLATIATNTGTSATQNTSTATNTASILTNTNAFKDTSTTGTVTNDNDVVSMALPGGQATAAVQILMGTLVGTLLFEVSPDSGTTWYSINGATPSGASLVSSATAAGSWRFNVSGMTNFRVRLHPVTSGTSGTITIRLSQGTSNVAVVNATTLGQQAMSVSSPVVVASDQSGIPVRNDFKEVIGSGTGVVTGTNTDFIPSTDVSNYSMLVLQTTGTWTMTLTVQFSNDNTNFSNGFATKYSTGAVASTITINDLFVIPRMGRFVRIRWVSGGGTNTSLAGNLECYNNTHPLFMYQAGTWTMQPGNLANTTSWVTKGATLTGTQAANSAANTVIKGSAGTLWNAVVTATGTAALDIFDNATTNSGTKLLSIPANAAVGTIYTFPGGMPAANGITSAGVTNCPAVTFAYGPA